MKRKEVINNDSLHENGFLHILEKIKLVNSMSDNKMNDHLTYNDLLTVVKNVKNKHLDKYFFEIEKNLQYADTIIKFVKLYVLNIKQIILEILKLFNELDPNIIFSDEYEKIVSTITKCVAEIDNIVYNAYYDKHRLLFLKGVDKDTTLRLNLFDTSNKDLTNIIIKIIPDNANFIFCLPFIDTISLDLFGYTLNIGYSNKLTEFFPYEKITNMEKYINKHIDKFNSAYDKIILEEIMIEKFETVLKTKIEMFYSNKNVITKEYFLKK